MFQDTPIVLESNPLPPFCIAFNIIYYPVTVVMPQCIGLLDCNGASICNVGIIYTVVLLSIKPPVSSRQCLCELDNAISDIVLQTKAHSTSSTIHAAHNVWVFVIYRFLSSTNVLFGTSGNGLAGLYLLSRSWGPRSRHGDRAAFKTRSCLLSLINANKEIYVAQPQGVSHAGETKQVVRSGDKTKNKMFSRTVESSGKGR